MLIKDQILNQFPGFIFGVVSAAIIIFLGGLSKLIFGEINRIRKHKLNIAIEVHKLCNEASSGNYKKKERIPEHVNSVLTDLDGINKEMGLVLNKFISLWRLTACKPTYKNNKEEELYLIAMINEIEEKRRILIEWSNKIRAGLKII